MIHARTRPEALAVLARAEAAAGLAGLPSAVLFSARCFKQRGALVALPKEPPHETCAADLDPLDRRILNALQEGFPLVPEPFAAVAAGLGIDANDLIARLARLKDGGAITRFGPFFDAAAMGGAFCLCAMAVPPGRFDAVAELVNAHARSRTTTRATTASTCGSCWRPRRPEAIAATAETIAAETGLPVLRLPKLEEFFIGFRVAA